MIYLLSVSLIWAFSFGLIKTNLAGIDPNFVSFTRCLLATVFFLPFTDFKNIKSRLFFKLLITGAVQFGLMYVLYIKSFKYLKSYEVAVFTIFTPLYIALLDYRLKRIFLFSSLSVLGAGIIAYKNISSHDMLYGFTLVQLSNLCFAYGQLQYKKIVLELGIVKEHKIFSIMFLGAAIAAFLPYSFSGNFSASYLYSLDKAQITTLLYLGIIASGICFFLWNKGAVKTDNRTLAVMNNLKIPLAVIVSVIFFKESTDYLKLAAGIITLVLALFSSSLRKTAN